MTLAPRPDPLDLHRLSASMPFLIRPRQASAHRPPVATGLGPLDAGLGGGFPRGQLSEIVGPRSSGRTSLLLASLACATDSGALVALVDATDGLDPASAHAIGVRLERLLWVRCGARLSQAMQAADVLVRGGGFDVVAVDLGDLPPWTLARIPTAVFVRLQRAVEATPTALLVVSPRRLGGSMAAVAVALAPVSARWARGGPGLLSERRIEARVIRARGRAPGPGVTVAWQVGGRP